jgi:hypothetical protein
MTNWRSLLQAAIMSRHGVVVAVSDAPSAKQQLYKERAKDPSLLGLQLRTSPDDPDHEIWIVKEKPNGS